jgi:hypothetical protein
MPQGNAYVLCNSKGLIPVSKLEQNDGILVYHPKQAIFSEIKELNKVPASQAVSLSTSSGHALSGTESSRILIIDNGSMELAQYNQLATGSSLYYNHNPIKSFRLYAEIPFSPSSELKERAEKNVYLPSLMTDDLARLIGWIDGDASISEDGVALCGPSDDPDKFEYYLSLFEKIFQVVRGKITRRSDNIFITSVGSLLIREWFKYVNVRGVTADSLPGCILHSGFSVWVNYLLGVWDTDGSLSDSGHDDGTYVPRLKQKGKQRMYQIAYILNLLGISVNVLERKPASKAQATLYDLKVRGQHSFKLFHELIGQHLISKKKKGRSLAVNVNTSSSTETDGFVSLHKMQTGEIGFFTIQTNEPYWCNTLFIKD